MTHAATRMTLDGLTALVQGDAVAIRGTAKLIPAGGPGDKIFPPTHSVDKNEQRPGAKYAFEKRLIDGAEVDCVLVDSVQSQANRMEEALEALWADRRITLPVIEVDFSESAPDVGRVTSLSAPHRIADALLRDSLYNGAFFRLSELGKSFADASIRNAGPLFKVCPTGLVFGLWDSTGPRGGLGAKFSRAISSELVGIRAKSGTKTASRIDPTGIIKKAGEVLEAEDPNDRWTLDPAKAKKDAKGKPIKLGDGNVSEVNHSNVPPTLDSVAGGVTVDHVSHVAVISLAGLRRLRFGGGELEARRVLAALALLALVAAESRGYDLRSRCLLVPTEGAALRLQAIAANGATTDLALDLNGAIDVYQGAVDALPEALRFTSAPGEALARLTPSPKLVHLVKESRRLAATTTAPEDE